MPSISIHLKIAREITKRVPRLDNGQFYLGNIIPDAVNYKGFASKKERFISHLRDSDLDIWEQNVINYFKNNDYSDYLLGYITHILGDISFDRNYYWVIRNRMTENNIPEEEQHQLLNKELNIYNNQFQEELEIKKVLDKIKKEKGYQIQNVTPEIVEKYKKRMVYYSDFNQEDLQYIKEEDIKNYIKEVKEKVLKLIEN